VSGNFHFKLERQAAEFLWSSMHTGYVQKVGLGLSDVKSFRVLCFFEWEIVVQESSCSSLFWFSDFSLSRAAHDAKCSFCVIDDVKLLRGVFFFFLCFFFPGSDQRQKLESELSELFPSSAVWWETSLTSLSEA
jgi:hypothetical protein